MAHKKRLLVISEIRVLRFRQELRSHARIEQTFEDVYAEGDVLELEAADVSAIGRVRAWRIANKPGMPLVKDTELALWRHECVREA